MRKTEWVFLGLGLVLLVVLLDRIGWGVLLRQFEQIGWYFLLVLLVSAGRYTSRTIAWRYAFAGDRELPSFAEMFGARLAGQSLGYLTFAGPFLGEPAKAALLRQQVPLAVGLGGALLEAGAYTIVSGFVLVAGLIAALARATMAEQMQRVVWILAALFLLLWLGGRTLLRRRVRVLTRLLTLLGRTPLRGWVDRQRARLESAEEQLLDFYAAHTRRFRLMFLWDLAAQAFAILEIYVILATMGLWVSWAEVLIIEALGKVITTTFFFVPGRVGTDEGSYAAVFVVLGFGAARGVGLALVQRLRSIVWTAAGLVFLTRYALRRPA